MSNGRKVQYMLGDRGSLAKGPETYDTRFSVKIYKSLVQNTFLFL